MPQYCVDTKAKPNGTHEIHDVTPGACHLLPPEADRMDLGEHSKCQPAVAKAIATYTTAIGCNHCCPGCHTI